MKSQKIILIIIIPVLLNCSSVRSQSIIIQPPLIVPTDCISLLQLYAATLHNLSDSTFRAALIGSISYGEGLGSLELLAEGTSSDFILPHGTLVIDEQLVEAQLLPVKYKFNRTDLKKSYLTTACLLPGIYEVCLKVLDFDNPTLPDGSQNLLGIQCFNFEIKGSSPLLLIIPFDGEEIKSHLPLFGWTQTTANYPDARYHLQIVEKLGFQSAYEAIQRNPVFYQESDIYNNLFMYPPHARPIDECKEFAWKVDVEDQKGRILNSSEIWAFKTVCPEQEENDDEKSDLPAERLAYYHLLDRDEGTPVPVVDGKLRFEIEIPFPDGHPIAFSVLNEQGQELKQKGGILNERYGDSVVHTGSNRYLLDLTEAGLATSGLYLLRLDGLKYPKFLRFKLIE